MITPAYAQAAGGGSGNILIDFLPFILILGVMYFLFIRPQQQRMKQHREMVAAVRRGDTVVTSGGIVGKITRVYDDNDEVQVEIAEGVKIRVVRSTLSDVRNKTEPVPAKEAPKKDESQKDDSSSD